MTGLAARRLRRGPLLLVALAGGAALSCGHTGRPVAPLPRVPATPTDVTWQQRGDALTVRATILAEGPGGRALRPPVRPVLLVFAPRSPALAVGWESPARAREFLRSAARRPGAPLDDAEPGTPRRVALEVPLDELPETEALVVALGLEDRREISLPSVRVTLRPLRPSLPAPRSVEVEPLEDGIRIGWPVPDDERATDAAIFRTKDGGTAGRRPWRLVPSGERSFVDTTAEYGHEYAYAVAFTAGRDDPLRMSPLAGGTAPVRYADVFPPRPPRELDAVPGSGRIRAFWFEGGSSDEAYVVVERSEDGGPWVEAGRVEVPDAFFEDRDVEAGRTYRYRARSVDAAGNESARTAPTGPIAPRPTP